MGNYESLYTWAMERQYELQREAAIRRLVRQARRDRDGSKAGQDEPASDRPLAPVIPLTVPAHHARSLHDDSGQDRTA